MTLRVAFVVPPKLSNGRFIEAEDCCWGAMNKRVLPAMLPACASQMEEAVFIDLSIDGAWAIRQARPDVVVYPVIWAYHREIMDRMKALLPKTPHIVIPVPFGYANDLAALKPRPFCVVNSEPEAIFAAFRARNVRELRAWRRNAEGLTWYEKGELYRSGWLPNCMGNLKQTDFGLIPRHYWKYYKKAVMYQVTRGCPYRCTFCVWGGSTCTDRTFKMRPARQVAQALHQIREHANRVLDTDVAEPVVVRLLSAQLTTRLDWIKAFHRFMVSRPYPFQGNVNLHELTEEKLRLLMEAGMWAASAGFEGLTNEALETMRKPHTFEEGLHGALLLEESGIKYKLNFRIGYGEKAGDVKQALTNLRRLHEAGIRRPRVKVAPLVYYKGTAIKENPPCETMQDPRFDVDMERMAGIPREWNRIGALIKEFGWGAG